MDDVFILDDDSIYFRGRLLKWAMLAAALLLIVVPRMLARRRTRDQHAASGTEKPKYNWVLLLGFAAHVQINAFALLMERNGALMKSDVYGIFTGQCPALWILVVFVNQMGVRRRPFSWPAVACFVVLMSIVGRINGYIVGLHSVGIWTSEIFVISWLVSGLIGGCVAAGKGYPAVAGVILAFLIGPLVLLIALFLPTTSRVLGISESGSNIDAELKAARVQKSCPKCGTVHSVVNKFCPSCMYPYPDTGPPSLVEQDLRDNEG